MVSFKNNVALMLPYDREQYLNYFDEEHTVKPVVTWYGVSMQLEDIRNEKLYNATNVVVLQAINTLKNSFNQLISLLDRGEVWILNHDDKDMPWFIKEDETLPDLRSLFRQSNIPDEYRGCVICTKEDLLTYAGDLVTYSYALSYKNLDVSHSKLQVIIKITGHLTLDLLGTDEHLLNDILSDSSFRFFTKVKYRTKR